MNKAQHTTQYIKHLAESTNYKDSTFNKLFRGLIVKRLECQTFHIPNRLLHKLM